MLLLMTVLKRILVITISFLVAFQLVACGVVTPAPTTVPSLTPSPPINTAIPPQTSTITASAKPSHLPTCTIIAEDGKLNVLSDDVFFAFGPDEETLDQALVENYPKWANFEQNVSWYSDPVKLSKIVREASFQEKFALNSAVTLITLGESLNWQLPPDGDLFLRSLTTGERLVRLWDEYSHPDNESIRSRYPDVSNGATYSLYVFFDYDKVKLQAWCNTYQQLFGSSP